MNRDRGPETASRRRVQRGARIEALVELKTTNAGVPDALGIALELRLVGLVLDVPLERVGAGRTACQAGSTN
jgi:hypothetical protein